MTQTVIPEWTVADRIRKARDVAGLEQEDLAALVYVARSTVSTWENAKGGVPHRLKLEKIAEVCGVSVSWLLTGHADTTDVDRDYRDGNWGALAA